MWKITVNLTSLVILVLLVLLTFVIWALIAWKAELVDIPIGVLIGVMAGTLFLREYLDRLLSKVAEMPNWMNVLIKATDHLRWRPTRVQSLLIGFVIPLLLLGCLAWAGVSWTALAFPISVLASWVLTVCWLLFYLRIRYGQLR